jgi:ribosomal protein S18 acetylase RimI-like enzyme
MRETLSEKSPLSQLVALEGLTEQEEAVYGPGEQLACSVTNSLDKGAYRGVEALRAQHALAQYTLGVVLVFAASQNRTALTLGLDPEFCQWERDALTILDLRDVQKKPLDVTSNSPKLYKMPDTGTYVRYNRPIARGSMTGSGLEQVFTAVPDPETGIIAYRNPKDSIPPAIFHAWQAALQDKDRNSDTLSPLAMFTNPYTGLTEWMATRNAVDAVLEAPDKFRAHIYDIPLRTDEKARLLSAPHTEHIRLPTQRSVRRHSIVVDGHDLPDMWALAIEPGASQEEIAQIMANAVERIRMSITVPGLTRERFSQSRANQLVPDMGPRAQEEDSIYRRFNPLLQPYEKNIPPFPFFTVRDATSGDEYIMAKIHVDDYVKEYGIRKQGTARNASRFALGYEINDTLLCERLKANYKKAILSSNAEMPEAGLKYKVSIINCMACGSGAVPHPAGFMVTEVNDDVAQINGLYVLEGHQGMGAGKAAWEETKLWLQNNSFAGRVDLITSVGTNAVRFYEKLGFMPWKESAGYALWPNGDKLEQVCMSLWINTPDAPKEGPLVGTSPLFWNADRAILEKRRK